MNKNKLEENTINMIISVFFLFLIIFIMSTKFKINIKNAFFQNKNIDYEIDFEIYILYFCKIFNIKFVKNGIKIFFIFIPYSKINIPELDNKLIKFMLKNDILKNSDYKIEKFNLKIQFGSNNALINVFFIPLLSIFLDFFGTSKANQINIKNYYYKIETIPRNLYLKVLFSGTISISLLSFYIFIRKLKSEPQNAYF